MRSLATPGPSAKYDAYFVSNGEPAQDKLTPEWRVNSRPAPSETTQDEPFQRATVQVRLRCAMPELGAILYALESGSPQLFVDNLDILSRRSYLGTGQEGGALDVSFDLYGYLKTPAGTPVDG